ncbi:MAG: YccF domain-containing protein, partial [Thermoleophilaceae bacterium]
MWVILAGFWLALGYLLAAIVMFILIVTIPFGIQAGKLAG